MGAKIGVVDAGGGYRGIYAAGVLDYCLDNQIYFVLGIGVSAGSADMISYAAEQARRNYRFYTEYGLRKEYAGIKNFLKGDADALRQLYEKGYRDGTKIVPFIM